MSSDTTSATEGTKDPRWLTFTGADQLVKLIGALFQRPRRGDRPRELDAGGAWTEYTDLDKRGLPLVHLVRPAGAASVLPGVKAWLDSTRPHGKVQAARCTLTTGNDAAHGGEPDPEQVREILRLVRNEFIGHTGWEKRLSFPLFTLVFKLMNKTIAEDDDNPDREMRRWLRVNASSSGLRVLIDRAGKVAGEEAPWPVRAFLAVARAADFLTFRLRVTGRVPLLSGRFRWFLKQPHMAPRMSGTFVRFARRLLEDAWRSEDPEYVSRLLVNAFLEDLRRAYGLRPWLFWRRRRMTYPVLLLEGATGTNGGLALLTLINSVRNQTGVFDPLLVIAETTEQPPDPKRTQPVQQAVEQYQRWQNGLRGKRLARKPDAWYLPVAVGTENDKAAVDSLEAIDHYQLRHRQFRPPWWTSRWLRFGAPVAVVLLVAGLLVVNYVDYRHDHCGTGVDTVSWTGTECVGVSDGTVNLYQPADVTILAVETTIRDQNAETERQHAQHPERPYITIVDLEALTSSTGDADGLVTERESLEGIAVAQYRQLNSPTQASPLVRVLIANGGRGMREGLRVAETLRTMAAKDSSIVAVVGLDISSAPTQNTISALTRAGIPMVASTLSADAFADENPMYFQVAPQNRRQAQVAAAFADQLHVPGHARSVRIYYSNDTADLYSANLRKDALAGFRAKGFAVSARAFLPNDAVRPASRDDLHGDKYVGNAGAAGKDTCSFDGYVFFAGRGVPDFGSFLEGAAQCVTDAVIIGDDDVTRFAADTNAVRLHPVGSYYYLSFATAPITQPKGVAQEFDDTQKALFPFERSAAGRSLDGHAALSYDGAKVVITAAKYLREAAAIPVTAGAIWREITAIHTSQPGDRQSNDSIEGVSGTIDYGGDLSHNVPTRKPVAVLRVSGGAVQGQLFGFCGQAKGHRSDTWCPTDPG